MIYKEYIIMSFITSPMMLSFCDKHLLNNEEFFYDILKGLEDLYTSQSIEMNEYNRRSFQIFLRASDEIKGQYFTPQTFLRIYENRIKFKQELNKNVVDKEQQKPFKI